ncbi:hypothetical protein H4R20_004352 [Coemansia guatemalensis]|uniref:Ribonuclease n=1 Tax=Coemansia guatemalensis TaxID=2761395 RepID=A0A9W8HUN8_9FUNG|nr:hypothetical protein H4R20_004352 [Coemansia guatemalensis]
MSATPLSRSHDDDDEEYSQASAFPVAKRPKLCAETTDDMQTYIELGLPINQALTTSYTFFSPLPEALDSADADDGFVLGVDEAGRGPVLGPMVYATCFCRESYYEQLGSVGFADSKQLTEEQRERLFLKLQTAEIRQHTGWSIRCISPQDISQSMLRRAKTSLNALAHDATIQLLHDAIERGVRVRKVFVDTVGPPATYQKKLQELFPQIEITVAKKADSIYPIVSAASICAKVTRDKHLENWVFAEPMLESLSTKYGSGYPGDPNTIKWLRESLDPVFGYPGIIRFSWSTCKKLLDECAARVSWADDEDDAPKNAKLKSRYFVRSTKDAAAADSRQRSKFFNRHKAIVLASSF